MNAGEPRCSPPYSEKGTQGSRGVTISRLVKALSAPRINSSRSRNGLSVRLDTRRLIMESPVATNVCTLMFSSPAASMLA